MYRPFCEEILGIAIDDVGYQDLEHYFQQERDETLFLEFKSYTNRPNDTRGRDAKASEKIRGVIKAISALLNSNGGLVIWGAPEPKEISRGEKKVKMCQGSLTPVPDFNDRDAFISKIVSQISPLPQGIRMQPIQVQGGYVYLFEVPESQYKPHQYDGRYYVRNDTRTDAAPHHWVYALCRQVRYPELALSLKGISNYNSVSHDYISIEVTAEIENITEFVNDHEAYLKVYTPNGGIGRTSLDKKATTVLFDNVAKILTYGLPIEFIFWVDIKRQSYPENQPFITIWFGGKNSMVKKVTYKIVMTGPSQVDYTGTSFSIGINLDIIDDTKLG
jgi:hypothetical protein